MPDQKMVVIKKGKKPEPYATVRKTASPAMKGDGDVNYLCGLCGFAVLENMAPGQISGLAFPCPVCRSTNGVPPA